MSEPLEAAVADAFGTRLVSAALIRIRTGHVAWYGVSEGDPGDPEHPATLASVAEMFARALLPFG